MTLMWIVLAALGGLCLLYLFLIAPRWPARDIGGLPGLYAHRGLWDDTAGRPENSLPAFRAAAERGFGIETDVHITRDDQLVVFHDDTLRRMCGTDRKIADCTLAELRACRLKDTGETIPTFDEFLRAAGSVPLIIEIKTDRRVLTICERTADRMKSYPGRWCVESFDPRAVRWFRKHCPDVIRGQLTFGLVSPSQMPKVPLLRLLASQVGNCLGRPDFMACEHQTDHSLPLRLVRLFHPHLAAWTVRSQKDMDALRGRYEIQIFEGFIPEEQAGKTPLARK